MAVRDGEGSLVAEGALATTTGPHTGRSPKDRFIVERPVIRAAIDWGITVSPKPFAMCPPADQRVRHPYRCR